VLNLTCILACTFFLGIERYSRTSITQTTNRHKKNWSYGDWGWLMCRLDLTCVSKIYVANKTSSTYRDFELGKVELLKLDCSDIFFFRIHEYLRSFLSENYTLLKYLCLTLFIFGFRCFWHSFFFHLKIVNFILVFNIIIQF